MTPANDPRAAAVARLLATVDRFRGAGGCAWFEAQTAASLVPFLQEETAELIDAIEVGSADDRREELGDVLFQVLFHADIAAANGEFDLADVAEEQRAKLLRRNPHVFGSTPSRDLDEIIAMWQEAKAVEKAGRASALDGIAFGMPALALAQKVLGRGSEVLEAEAAEDQAARLSVPARDPKPLTEEALGEALFALAGEASAAGLDAERALRMQVRAYAERVRAAERGADVDRRVTNPAAQPGQGAPRAEDTMI